MGALNKQIFDFANEIRNGCGHSHIYHRVDMGISWAKFRFLRNIPYTAITREIYKDLTSEKKLIG
jgi:hypothetical protein